MTNWSMLRYLGCEDLGREIEKEEKRQDKIVLGLHPFQKPVISRTYVETIIVDDPEHNPFPRAERAEFEVMDD